jgi:hypothetical protein
MEVDVSEETDKRLNQFFEEMVAGNLGFTSSAPAEGPVAGYDPVMGKPVKRKTKKQSDLEKK